MLDLDALEADPFPDGRIRADIRLDELRSRPDVDWAAQLRALQPGARVDVHATLDARVREVDADARALDRVERERVRLEYPVDRTVVAPRGFKLDHVVAARGRYVGG